MRKIRVLGLLLVLGLGLSTPHLLAASAPTCSGPVSGVVVGTQAQATAAGASTGAGDHYVADELSCSGVFTAYGGFVNIRDVFINVPVASDNGYFDFDISTANLVAGTTSPTFGLTQPYQSINVTAVVTFDTGLATTAVTGTMLITGVNARGVSTTETLTISTNNATSNNAWSSFTSFAWTVTAVTGREDATEASLQVGPATKLGLSNALAASGDVIGAMLEDSGTTTTETTITVDTTYNTWTPSTAGDGSADIYTITYTVDSK